MAGTEPPTFDPDSDEDSLPFYKCRAEDISGGGFQDLVCYSFTGGIPNGEIPGGTFIW